MKKLLTVAAVGVVAMLILGGTCPGPGILEAPTISSVKMADGAMTVYWNPSIDEEHEDFTGYNVYLFTDSTLYDLSGDNDTLADYLVNSTPTTDTSLAISNLSNDTIYYIQVRTVSGEDQVGDYNLNQPYVSASPRPEFTVTLNFEESESNQNEPGVAVVFATGTVVDEVNGEFPDADAFADHYVKADSTQLVSADARPNGRHTLIVLETGTYDEFWDASGVDFGTSDRALFSEGDLLVAKTQDGNYVKISIEAIDNTTTPWTVDLKFAYQNIPDFPRF